MATSWTQVGRNGVNWSPTTDPAQTDWAAANNVGTNWNLTGDIASTWNEGSAGVETNWSAITGTEIDWSQVDPSLDLVPGEQLPFMQDDSAFYFGSGLDFGIEYDSVGDEFHITTGGEKAFGITKTKVVSLATLTVAPDENEKGNMAYVNGKLMIKEES